MPRPWFAKTGSVKGRPVDVLLEIGPSPVPLSRKGLGWNTIIRCICGPSSSYECVEILAVGILAARRVRRSIDLH